MVIVLYRIGSSPVNMKFLDDLSDIMERVAIYSAPLIIVGDLNMHLDDTISGYTRRFSEILLDFDLVQLIKEPTHLAGYLLDVVIEPKTLAEPTVMVDPPVISDPSLISCGFLMEKDAKCNSRIKKRRWRNFDINNFRQDLSESELVVNPPDDLDDLVRCYNYTLLEILDTHAPESSVKSRCRTSSPWYNSTCKRTKLETRRLERIYRSTKTDEARAKWRDQFKHQRGTF